MVVEYVKCSVEYRSVQLLRRSDTLFIMRPGTTRNCKVSLPQTHKNPLFQTKGRHRPE